MTSAKIEELFDKVAIAKSREGSCLVCGEWNKSHHYFKEFDVAVCPCHQADLNSDVKELMAEENFKVENFSTADELELAAIQIDASSIAEGYSLWNLHFMHLKCINEYLSKLQRPLVDHCFNWEATIPGVDTHGKCCENFGRFN
jgi:hypothetical protein